MTGKPVVSVICTVYNKAPWLRTTIESFLAQETTFPVEILLIDDASTDHSAEIVAEFTATYPERIRAFYNDSNLGIAKTWVKICKEAQGEYIARCDGDDFWLDQKKLQKQVDLLETTPEARWSNTDFDIYDENGNFISAAGFENGDIPLADTFEKMLATRGFTMASTWLVERDLMLEVNALLDTSTSDDTFNLQMDLFQRTTLAYLPEATVAYRVNQGSDSRPKDFAKLVERFNKLLDTQNAYLDKYPNSNYREMLRILLDRNNRYELELSKRGNISADTVTLYFDIAGQGFSQNLTEQHALQIQDNLTFQLPQDCQRIRVDLSEQPSFYRYVRLISTRTNTEILPSFKNAIVLDSAYIFPNPDPQIIYELPQEVYGTEFRLEYEMLEIMDIHSDDYIGKFLAQELLDKTVKVEQLTREKINYLQEIQQLQTVRQQLEEVTHAYNSVIHSRRWTIPTKIINFFRRK